MVDVVGALAIIDEVDIASSTTVMPAEDHLNSPWPIGHLLPQNPKFSINNDVDVFSNYWKCSALSLDKSLAPKLIVMRVVCNSCT
jgi:hypothetical protein